MVVAGSGFRGAGGVVVGHVLNLAATEVTIKEHLSEYAIVYVCGLWSVACGMWSVGLIGWGGVKD